ncbi:flavodoxin [Tetragenococcus koreensis]|uniref:Flavodoxin n=1 Tax=Tetragenococcus koreensis TaxID=290335 RepID=A0AAN4UCN1_9ENTE|nr:flavodoxin [Tetragenococcus koreensis]AYW44542.1 flavodoxin [Tetragenococcus koreensis]MCF1584215.1 flavodoxin [Tetragenococcus koreensis]MCF1613851.1 flavodoxin [Tetragenococcus koreensis]MCF1617736.1 flavodoxin [Tetragenococcus koreensis]MCF1619561.1 flavodoxin [Tetragenococcus koreensis]
MTLAKIIYGSLTGNTEEIADIICEALENLNIEVEIDECTQVDAAEFSNADICVIAAYTYDEGTIPDEMLDLYEDLQELDLSGKVFGVCGSGDTFYEHYATAVDKFEEAFLVAGATKGAEKIKVDLAAEKEDIQQLGSFASQLVAAQQSA